MPNGSCDVLVSISDALTRVADCCDTPVAAHVKPADALTHGEPKNVTEKTFVVEEPAYAGQVSLPLMKHSEPQSTLVASAAHR